MIGNLTKSSLIIKEYLETLNKIEKWHDWELNKEFPDWQDWELNKEFSDWHDWELNKEFPDN